MKFSEIWRLWVQVSSVLFYFLNFQMKGWLTSGQFRGLELCSGSGVTGEQHVVEGARVWEKRQALGPSGKHCLWSTRGLCRTTPHRNCPADSHDSVFWSPTHHPIAAPSWPPQDLAAAAAREKGQGSHLPAKPLPVESPFFTLSCLSLLVAFGPHMGLSTQ